MNTFMLQEIEKRIEAKRYADVFAKEDIEWLVKNLNSLLKIGLKEMNQKDVIEFRARCREIVNGTEYEQ